MSKKPLEWFKQADYDMDTAEYMFEGKRYEKINLDLPQELYDFVFTLNRVSVPTRYPDDMAKIMKEFDRKKTKEILTKGKEVLEWLKARSEKQ